MYVNERFRLTRAYEDQIRKIPVNFGWPESGFGEYIYYRHYSRVIRDDLGVELGQEDWHDTVLRVINGVISIRKDWYVRNNIAWDEPAWQGYAFLMAKSLARMEWLPPGRGLWAMGSEVVYERGAMPLYNCAYTDIGNNWIDDLCWNMDCLMNGVGVGFGPLRNGLKLKEPTHTQTYQIPDTREGWVASLRLLLRAFVEDKPLPEFDYSQIRPEGSPIVSFGGIASGPDPLENMHKLVTELCYRYARGDYDEIQFKTDLANISGVCVISGNVRRGAQIACGDPDDHVFWHLKNYDKYPERAAWGWMSNNSVRLSQDHHFEMLDQIGLANARGNDVGFINLKNLRHGRIGKFSDYVHEDKAIGFNPCGEIPLEHREVCNLAETLPTRCATHEDWLNACEYATTYCSTVALLPTHHSSTNAVVARNRRIGVSIIDFTGWKHVEGVRNVTRYLREGYQRIRTRNHRLADQAGVPRSIRVTTVKPGGTVPRLAGRTSGASHPTFEYILRRVNVGKGTPVDKVLQAAGFPFEQSVYTETSNIYGFPVKQGPAEPATEISIWEQALNVVLLQREWSDNAVSNTLYFKPMWSKINGPSVYEENGSLSVNGEWIDESKFEHSWEDEGVLYKWDVVESVLYRYNPDHEEGDLEAVLAHVAPYVKSLSLLPHTDEGVFKQMPEEGITREKYLQLLKDLPRVDWSNLSSSDGVDEKYCDGDKCVIPEA